MTWYHSTFSTPTGAFTLAVNAAGAVVAAGFGPPDALPLPPAECHLISDTGLAAAAREQVLDYFSGRRREFDLALAPAGSEFQLRVWQALQKIPFGKTRSYGELARQLGSSARAVGRANATNPICVIVPCHRVIGADGSLTGYSGGMDNKRWLLTHEGALDPALV